MVMLAEAIAAEREKRQRDSKDAVARREVGREVLRALAQRLTAEPLPSWYFILNGDEIVVVHTKNGTGSRQRVGAWVVDPELRLVFGQEMTEWITTESWARVVDEAVQITAQVIVDAEIRLIGRIDIPQRSEHSA
jgi:hypothetical protein